MKIVIATTYYLPNISGLSLHASILARELVKRGWEVEVITSRHDFNFNSQKINSNYFIKRVWAPIKISRGVIMPTFPLESLLSVYKSDVVNTHLPSVESIFVAFWAKVFGKRLVSTYHCDLTSSTGIVDRVALKVAYLANFFTCLLSDKIVVTSKDYAENSSFLNRFKNKIVEIYPPFELAKPKPGNLVGRIDKNKIKIGFVGRIAKEKGLDYLLNSIPDLSKELKKDFKIYIVGPKDVIGGGYFKKIKSLLEKYKGRVLLLGKLTDPELSYFYKQMDVLVLPSLESIEAFGVVQVEAFVCGCPVVSTNLPGVRIPIKKTGMGVIIPPRNSKQIANAISKIIKNKKRFISSKSSITNIFSLEKTVDSYEQVFKELSK